jgi:hypothetical protein
MSIVPTAQSIPASSGAPGQTPSTASSSNTSANVDPTMSNLSVAALSSGNNKQNQQPAKTQPPSVATLNMPPAQQQSPQQQQQQQQQQPIYDDINIFMWSVCKICNKSTKKTAMSPDTWSYSLAKFLELTFHGKQYHQFNDSSGRDCKHSLFNDHYQYFRFKNIVTVFSLSNISMKSINLPGHDLRTGSSTGSGSSFSSCASARPREEYLDEIKELFDKGQSLFMSLTDRLSALKGINLHEKQIKMLDQYITQIMTDSTLKAKSEKIHLLLTIHESKDGLMSAAANETTSELQQRQQKNINYDLIDMLLIDMRKYIAFTVHSWNVKMNDFFKKTKFDDVKFLSFWLDKQLFLSYIHLFFICNNRNRLLYSPVIPTRVLWIYPRR